MAARLRCGRIGGSSWRWSREGARRRAANKSQAAERVADRDGIVCFRRMERWGMSGKRWTVPRRALRACRCVCPGVA
jgi:hypothetical protein